MIRNRRQFESSVSDSVAELLSRGKVRAEQGKAISLEAHEKRLRKLLHQVYRDLFIKSARSLFRSARATMPALQAADEAERWADSYSQDIAAAIRRTTEDMLLTAIPEDIEDILGQARADRIGITEVTRALSAGENWAEAMLGAAEVLWISLEGACPVCKPLNGKPRRVWAIVAPDGPPSHPRCRCRRRYVFE